jgi:hypothetical protein
LLEVVAGLHNRCRLLFGARHISEVRRWVWPISTSILWSDNTIQIQEQRFTNLIYTAMFHGGSATLTQTNSLRGVHHDVLENNRLKSWEYESFWSWSPSAEDIIMTVFIGNILIVWPQPSITNIKHHASCLRVGMGRRDHAAWVDPLSVRTLWRHQNSHYHGQTVATGLRNSRSLSHTASIYVSPYCPPK